MRWERLFADLQAQLEAADAAELDAEVMDRTRRELATVALLDRLRAATGHTLTVRTVSATVTASLERVGADWLLLQERGHELALPLASVLAIQGLPALAVRADTDAVRSRLDFGYLLRVLARDRQPVTVRLVGGTLLAGTIDRVGADHFELAEHDPGAPRRESELRGVRTVAVSAVEVIRSAAPVG